MRIVSLLAPVLTFFALSGCSSDKSVSPGGPPGDIAVLSMPEGARVKFAPVQGGELGRPDSTLTPDTLRLNPGSYEFSFELTGFEPVRITKDVISNEFVDLNVSFKPDSSSH